MEKFTKYEVARILGARGLQIAMDAPLLIKMSKEQLEKVKYDPIEIARIELESNVLPITINRPFPKKIERKLSREKEKAVKEGGEIMELVTPEDEVEETSEEPEEGVE